MIAFSLLIALTGALELPMPPPPPGMVLLAQAPRAAQSDAGVGDGGSALEALVFEAAPPKSDDEDLPELKEDDELSAMRAVEEAAIDPAAEAGASMRATVGELGMATLTRDRLEEALNEADLSGEALAVEVPLVTDLARFDMSLVKNNFDIPVEMQPLVVKYVQFFQGAGRKWFRRWMSRSTRFIPIMQPILESKGLPRDTVYLAMIESGFNTQAKSWAKAVGPWQFIAGTAKMFNLRDDFWVDERRDPVKATYAAAAYLGLLHEKLGHWYLAWAGYNTGGGRVRRMVEAYNTTDFWELSGKRGFAKETQHYVPKLIACALVAKHPEAFGFDVKEFDFEPVFEYDEVQLTDSVDLEVIAQASGVPIQDIQELNPELRRWCTPPSSKEAPYVMRLPRGKKDVFAENFAKLAPTERLNFKIHRVARGDTLSKVALKYRSAQEAILRMNHLTSARTLAVGTDLVVPVPSTGAVTAGRQDVAFERQVARARRSGLVAQRPEQEIPAGTQAPKGKAAVGGSISEEMVGGKKRVSYGVASGDTLWAIARKFDVHVSELKEWNPALVSGRGLKVGVAVTIWPGANADLTKNESTQVAPKPKVFVKPGTTHKVASGETLWSISRKYGVTMDALKEWNKLGDGGLKKGQILVVSHELR